MNKHQNISDQSDQLAQDSPKEPSSANNNASIDQQKWTNYCKTLENLIN